MIDQNIEGKHIHVSLGSSCQNKAPVENIDPNDQPQSDPSDDAQRAMTNDIKNSHPRTEVYEEKIEDDIDDVCDEKPFENTHEIQHVEALPKVPALNQGSGVNLDEVSAIRAAAQAQIER